MWHPKIGQESLASRTFRPHLETVAQGTDEDLDCDGGNAMDSWKDKPANVLKD